MQLLREVISKPLGFELAIQRKCRANYQSKFPLQLDFVDSAYLTLKPIILQI